MKAIRITSARSIADQLLAAPPTSSSCLQCARWIEGSVPGAKESLPILKDVMSSRELL